MIVTSHVGEAEAVAHLLREMKAIATKELESLSFQALDSVLSQTPPLKYSSIGVEEEPRSDVRKRTISVESDDGIINNKNSKKLASLCLCKTPVPTGPLTSLNHSDYIEHNDWSNCDALRSDPQLATSNASPAKKGAKRKSESFVGNTTKSGIVRATLRKKFSWKQYPELENFLLANQEDYFEYSSRNYTAEQRKYNNNLTRELLDLASIQDYTFEEFTFSQVRDRIRCYYKSYSQSAKKKGKR